MRSGTHLISGRLLRCERTISRLCSAQITTFPPNSGRPVSQEQALIDTMTSARTRAETVLTESERNAVQRLDKLVTDELKKDERLLDTAILEPIERAFVRVEREVEKDVKAIEDEIEKDARIFGLRSPGSVRLRGPDAALETRWSE